MSRWAPIHKQVSPSEIEGLLAEGLTRTEVCKRLEISYPTLLKLIGTDKTRKPYGTARPKPGVPIPPVEPVERAPMTLQEAMEEDARRREAEKEAFLKRVEEIEHRIEEEKAAEPTAPLTDMEKPKAPDTPKPAETVRRETTQPPRSRFGRRTVDTLTGEWITVTVMTPENLVRVECAAAPDDPLSLDDFKELVREMMSGYAEAKKIMGGQTA